MKRAAALGSLIFVIAACSSNTSLDAHGPPSLPDLEEAESTVRLRPLVMAAAGAHDPIVDSEIQNRIADCMESYGFTYLPETIDQANQDSAEADNISIRDGLSETEGRRYDEALFGTEASRETITDAKGNVISSVSGTGCLADATHQVTGRTLREYAQLYRDVKPFLSDLDEAIESDERTREAWTDWADCMADAGYSVKNREDSYRLQSESPHSEQIAATDKQCDQSTDLDNRLGLVEIAWEQRFLELYPEIAARLTGESN